VIETHEHKGESKKWLEAVR